MLHGVGDVGEAAVDAGFGERFIKKTSSGTDEGFAGEIFLIARNLSHEHDLTIGAAFAEDGLRAAFPEIAGFAVFGDFGEGGQRRSGGDFALGGIGGGVDGERGIALLHGDWMRWGE